MGNTTLIITICILLVMAAEGRRTAVEKLVAAMNRFGINLYLNLINEKENVFCSPLSATVLLNTLLFGVQNGTAREIWSALGYKNFKLSQDEVHKALLQFLSGLDRNHAGFTSGKSIWIQKGLRFQSTELHSQAYRVDFTRPVVASVQISNWIRKITPHESIKIASSEIDRKTKLLLASVLDFTHGTWHYQFNTSKTKREPFYINQGQKVLHVPMMLMSGYFNYVHSVDLNSELVEIPYAGKDLTMVIILSKDMNGIMDQKELFSAEKVTRAIQEMATPRLGIHLRIPRFIVMSSLKLKGALKRLGIVKSFTPGQLDGTKGLSVSEIIQKTVILVWERGSLPDPNFNIPKRVPVGDYDAKVVYFTVDHPFTFLIRHKPTGGIIFIGQVMKPQR